MMLNSSGKVSFFVEKFSESMRRMKERSERAYSKIKNTLSSVSEAKLLHINVTKMNDEAQIKYIPKKYNGKVAIFRPKKDFVGFEDPLFGWGHLALGGIDLFKFPVNPRGMLVEPFVRDVAGKLNELINATLEKEKKKEVAYEE
jgi:hypothetical protein